MKLFIVNKLIFKESKRQIYAITNLRLNGIILLAVIIKVVCFYEEYKLRPASYFK